MSVLKEVSKKNIEYCRAQPQLRDVFVRGDLHAFPAQGAPCRVRQLQQATAGQGVPTWNQVYMLKKPIFTLITFKMIHEIIYFCERKVSLCAVQNIHLRCNTLYVNLTKLYVTCSISTQLILF